MATDFYARFAKKLRAMAREDLMDKLSKNVNPKARSVLVEVDNVGVSYQPVNVQDIRPSNDSVKAFFFKLDDGDIFTFVLYGEPEGGVRVVAAGYLDDVLEALSKRSDKVAAQAVGVLAAVRKYFTGRDFPTPPEGMGLKNAVHKELEKIRKRRSRYGDVHLHNWGYVYATEYTTKEGKLERFITAELLHNDLMMLGRPPGSSMVYFIIPTNRPRPFVVAFYRDAEGKVRVYDYDDLDKIEAALAEEKSDPVVARFAEITRDVLDALKQFYGIS